MNENNLEPISFEPDDELQKEIDSFQEGEAPKEEQKQVAPDGLEAIPFDAEETEKKEKEESPKEEPSKEEQEKEKEGEDVKQEETNSEETSSDESSSSSPEIEIDAEALSKALMSEGVISEDSFDEEEFKGWIEEYGEGAVKMAIDKHVTQQIDSFKKDYEEKRKQSFTPEQQEFIDMLEDGIPFEEAKSLTEGYKRYESVKDSDIEVDQDLAKKLIKEDLSDSDVLSQEQIDEFIESLDEEKVVEYGKNSKSKLIDRGKKQKEEKAQKTKESKKKQQEEQQKVIENFKNFTYKTSEPIEGVKINKQTQDKIFETATTPVDEVNGQSVNSFMQKQMKSPEAINYLTYWYETMGLFNIDEQGNPAPDISKIKKILGTKATEKKEGFLKKNSGQVSEKGKSIKKDEDSSTKRDALEFLRRAK